MRRSTKSEKMYPSVLSRAPDHIESEPYYCLPVGAQGNFTWSQPTSPQPTPSRGFTGLLSPTQNPSHRLTYPKKNDEGKIVGNFKVTSIKVLNVNPLDIFFCSAWQSNITNVGCIIYVRLNYGGAEASK